MMWANVDFIAVIVAAIASFAIGWAWHSPMLFGREWMEGSGKSPADLGREKQNMNMGGSFAVQFVLSLVTAYALAVLINYLHLTSVASAIKLSLLVSIGFMATLRYGGVLWMGTSKKLFTIAAGNDIVNTAVMSVILTLWQ